MKHNTGKLFIILLILFAIGIYFLTYLSPIDVYRSGDSRGSLLTTQAILEHHTIQLDAYYPQIKDNLYYQYKEKNGHYYYTFPIGTSFFALPFVWVSRLSGQDMSILQHEMDLQQILAALTSVLAFLLVVLICRCYLNDIQSLLFSLMFVLGGPLVSTMGNTLWNLNLTLLFNLSSILLLVYDACGKTKKLNPYLLGFFLFSAYICRPTAAVFIVAVFIYLFFWKRDVFLKVGITSFGLFVLFVLFSYGEFGQWLPDYYLPGRLNNQAFWTAVWGNLVSPSRGVLIYSPFLIMTVVGVFLYFKRVIHLPFFIVMGLWGILHVVTISRFPHWWAGACFGPRFFTDAFPAWIMLTLLVYREGFLKLNNRRRMIAMALTVVLGVAGVFINSYQGLHNPLVLELNYDDYQEYLFDWRFAMFMAGPEMVQRRQYDITIKKKLQTAQPYHLETDITPVTGNAIFRHWLRKAAVPVPIGVAPASYRWANGRFAKIILKIDTTNFSQLAVCRLELEACVLKDHTVTVEMNEFKLGEIRGESELDGSARRYAFEFPALRLQQINTLAFTITASQTPRHALRFHRLKLSLH